MSEYTMDVTFSAKITVTFDEPFTVEENNSPVRGVGEKFHELVIDRKLTGEAKVALEDKVWRGDVESVEAFSPTDVTISGGGE